MGFLSCSLSIVFSPVRQMYVPKILYRTALFSTQKGVLMSSQIEVYFSTSECVTKWTGSLSK